MNTAYFFAFLMLIAVSIVWLSSSIDNAVTTKSDFYILFFPIVDADYDSYIIVKFVDCTSVDTALITNGYWIDAGNFTTSLFKKVDKQNISPELTFESIEEYCSNNFVPAPEQSKDERIKELINELQELVK